MDDEAEIYIVGGIHLKERSVESNIEVAGKSRNAADLSQNSVFPADTNGGKIITGIFNIRFYL